MSKRKKLNITNSLIDGHSNEISKYVFGDLGSRLDEVKYHRPVFAFDYISVNSSDFCFNSKLMAGVKDYHKIFSNLKSISRKSYNELSKGYSFHFHEVDFSDISFSKSDFVKSIVADQNKTDKNFCPTVYQFKIFEEARIFGFIHKTIFYLVFFDRNHNAYKRK